MRLEIDRLSSARTALELIPYKRARPTAGYFRAGHRLLDSLTHALPTGETAEKAQATQDQLRLGGTPLGALARAAADR
jgi:hypothetical protein